MKKVFKNTIIWSLILSLFIEATPVWALSKDETIYAKLNSDGSTSSITVSEHLNDKGNDIIIDRSHLNNIKNVNGEETYTKDGNKLVWEAKGNDIYYEGDTSEDLPITINVKYYLNDEEMNVKDMLGKAGKVRIELVYNNNKVNYVPVNGKVETLYTPFVVATTSLIDNTNNKNIEVTNGRVIDNGTTSLVVGIASPGLYDSLGLKELKEMDKTVISYTTKDFELNTIYSVATSKILEDSDLDVFNNLKDLYSSIGLLQDNMNTLVDASNKLKDGSNKLANGTNELNKAITGISNTYFSYRNMNKEELKKQFSKIIENNIKDIVPVLQDIVVEETTKSIQKNKKEIEKSVVEYSIKNTKEVVNGEIERIVSNIDVEEIISNIIGSDLLNAVLSDESLKELSKVLKEELNKEIEKEVTKTTKNAINSMSSSIKNNMSDEEKIAYVQNIANKYNISFEQAAAIVGEVQSDTINGIKNSISNSSDDISKNVSNQVISSLDNHDYVNSLVNDYVNNVNNRIKDIISNDSSLEEYQKELINNISETIKKELSKEEIIKKYTKVNEYADGLIDKIIYNTARDVSELYTEDIAMEVINKTINDQLSEENINNELSKLLNKYEKKLDEKLVIVDNNVSKLQSSVEMLNDGTNQLAEGMELFNNGITKYNNEGIKKLSGFVNGDVKSIEGKIEALINLSNSYQTLDDKDSDATGSSKIIYMIDSVKKEKEKKVNSEKIADKKSFGDKIKGLFK